MAQSLSRVAVHIVFSTRNRIPLINTSVENSLHGYLGGVCKGLECVPIEIGGTTDHVHILCFLSRKISIMKMTEEIKKNSSRWIKEQDTSCAAFSWQDGYAVFAVSSDQIERTRIYIRNQHEHHSKRSFKEELIMMLDENQIQYDERYLWS